MNVEDRLRRAKRISDPLERARAIHTNAMPEAARLWDEAVRARSRAILEAHEAGHSMQDIATALGVSKSNIQVVLRNAREERDGATTECSEDGCNRQVYARGLCQRHYRERFLHRSA